MFSRLRPHTTQRHSCHCRDVEKQHVLRPHREGRAVLAGRRCDLDAPWCVIWRISKSNNSARSAPDIRQKFSKLYPRSKHKNVKTKHDCNHTNYFYIKPCEYQIAITVVSGTTTLGDTLMKSSVIKRSIMINGHKTSVSLEDAFWRGLKDIARGQQATLSNVVAEIDKARKRGNLSSAIRLLCSTRYAGQRQPGPQCSRRLKQKGLNRRPSPVTNLIV